MSKFARLQIYIILRTQQIVLKKNRQSGKISPKTRLYDRKARLLFYRCSSPKYYSLSEDFTYSIQKFADSHKRKKSPARR